MRRALRTSAALLLSTALAGAFSVAGGGNKRGDQVARAEVQQPEPRSPGPPPPARTPDIHFAPTRYAVADEMLKFANVRAGDVVYDLGSGDGRILVLAAQKYGARGVGIELVPSLVELARRVAREGEVGDKVTFMEGDLFTADISKATVVTLYLSRGVNARLEPKLRHELRSGTRIVSHQFGIGRWVPERSMRAEDGTDLFLWTVPAR